MIFDKHYICRNYFIIISPFPINMFFNWAQLFFDATLKSCVDKRYSFVEDIHNFIIKYNNL